MIKEDGESIVALPETTLQVVEAIGMTPALATPCSGKAVVAPFVAEYELTFPVLVDPQNVVGTRLLVQGIPTSYLLDKQGRIAGLERGSKNWNSARFRRLLDSLLAEGGATP